MVRKNWLVRANPCQVKLQKVACPKEALSDHFVKVRLWEWSFVRLIYEIHTVKVKFCQSELWMLYCTGVVLSGKLFRVKTSLWLNPISVNLLCKSKSSQLVYSLQPLKVLPSSAYHFGMPFKRWATHLFMPPWPSHTCVRITCFFLTRVYILVCTHSCSACRLHPFAIRLGWTQLGSGHKNYFGPSPDQPLLTELTFDWKQQHAKF